MRSNFLFKSNVYPLIEDCSHIRFRLEENDYHCTFEIPDPIKIGDIRPYRDFNFVTRVFSEKKLKEIKALNALSFLPEPQAWCLEKSAGNNMLKFTFENEKSDLGKNSACFRSIFKMGQYDKKEFVRCEVLGISPQNSRHENKNTAKGFPVLLKTDELFGSDFSLRTFSDISKYFSNDENRDADTECIILRRRKSDAKDAKKAHSEQLSPNESLKIHMSRYLSRVDLDYKGGGNGATFDNDSPSDGFFDAHPGVPEEQIK